VSDSGDSDDFGGGGSAHGGGDDATISSVEEDRGVASYEGPCIGRNRWRRGQICRPRAQGWLDLAVDGNLVTQLRHRPGDTG
jgi:hypothetical protein